MHGVPQFVGQGRQVVGAALVIGQHPRRERGEDAHAEGAVALAGTDLGIQPPVGHNPFGEGGEGRIEFLEAPAHQVPCPAETELLFRRRDGGINIVAAQFGQAQRARLQPEVFLEHRRVRAAYVQKQADHLVREIVGEVADRDRRGEFAQADVFIPPIANERGIDLPEDRPLAAVDAVHRAVGRLADRRIRGAGEDGQLGPAELPARAVDFQVE